MDYKKIKVEVTDGVAVVTMNDPTTMNAAGLDLAEELSHAFRSLAAGKIEARAIVLTGEGRGFCSGANLSGGGASGRNASATAISAAGRKVIAMRPPCDDRVATRLPSLRDKSVILPRTVALHNAAVAPANASPSAPAGKTNRVGMPKSGSGVSSGPRTFTDRTCQLFTAMAPSARRRAARPDPAPNQRSRCSELHRACQPVRPLRRAPRLRHRVRWDAPQRGDVITFDSPLDEVNLIKRVDESRWRAFARPAKRLQVGDRIAFSAEGRVCFAGDLAATVTWSSNGRTAAPAASGEGQNMGR